MTTLQKSLAAAAALLFAFAANCTAAPPQSGAAQATAPSVKNPPVRTELANEAVRSDFWFASTPVQGGLLLGRAPSGVQSVLFGGQSVPVAADGFFLIGFDRDAAPNAMVTAQLPSGRTVSKSLTIAAGDWRLEYVNAPYRGGAKSSAEFERRRGAELAQIGAARAQNNDSGGWRQEFIWPIKGWLSGFFGAQRIYQGKAGSYHSGMDIAAAGGTPFVAPADGVVILAASAPFTLEGNLLMIDHGMGLNSAFLHCSELLVKTGDVVKQGQVIGKVGATGRATGPHLHWGMKWHDARVDPKLLLPD
ncbi:MAG: M23 family metallopeptidase [Sphingomonadales bacterium]|nr:M23 family metallopeptidase [Sphingomonadales bacterium]